MSNVHPPAEPPEAYAAQQPRADLTTAEAERPLAEHGPNVLDERRRSVLRKLLSYFRGPIRWMIEIAASARLFLTAEITQILGTLAAVYGWLVEPIG